MLRLVLIWSLLFLCAEADTEFLLLHVESAKVASRHSGTGLRSAAEAGNPGAREAAAENSRRAGAGTPRGTMNTGCCLDFASN